NYALEVDGEEPNIRYKIIFQDEINSDNIQYIALSSDSKLKPKAIIPEKPYNEDFPSLTLKDPGNSADYLIITHQKFYERSLDLARLRQNRGLNVVVVKVQDIYDEFNYGIKSPLAIQQFLRYAFYNWDRSHRLKYLLLVGDANYNYKSETGVNIDYLPTVFFQSIEFGAVATDLPYAQVAGNDVLPDIFVGRLPVTTNGELINIIEKIREHEESPIFDEWRNQSLFISGNDRSTYEFSQISYIPRKPAFRTQNQRVIDMLLDKNFSSFKLNTIRDTSLAFDPNFGGTTDLIDYFDNGVNFVNFFGHGGGGIWADVQLMNLQDVERLNNKGKYPFVTSMTCFTGEFDNPGSFGLAHRLVAVPDKGAIGILASSGLGWLSNDYSMLWNMMKNLFRDNITIGEATTLGKIDYFISSQYVLGDTVIPGYQWGHPGLKYDMIYEYNLIGDPFVSFGKPADEIAVSVDNDLPLPGDTIQVTLQAPFTSAEGYLELAASNNDIVSREPVFYSGNSSSYNLIIPGNYPRSAGFVRAYLSDNTRDAAGHKQIGIHYTVFDSVSTIPARPNAEDSVQISLLARDEMGISEVKIVAVLPGKVIAKDTVHLRTVETESGKFVTLEKVPPTRTLTTVYFFVYAVNSQGQQSRMNYSYEVEDNRPDPYIFPNSFRLAGKEKVQFALTLGNNGDLPAQSVRVQAYNSRNNFLQRIAFDTQNVSVDAKDSTTVLLNFPFYLDSASYHIYARLDPEEQSPDFNRLNNIDSSLISIHLYNVTPEFGTTYDGVNNDTISLGDKVNLWIGPNSITNPSAVQFMLSGFIPEWENDNLIGFTLDDDNVPDIIKLQKLNNDAQLLSPFLLRIQLDSTILNSDVYSFEDLRFYRFDERLKTWIQYESTVDLDSMILKADLLQDGIYAPFVSQDKQPPQVKLTIDGRRVVTSSLVAPKPVLNILIEDGSGIDINRDRLVIAIDDNPLTGEQVFIPDSVQQSNILGITAYPELAVGNHSLSVEVRDVNGNVTREEYTLQVSTEFDLHVFGNYPNPFSDETVFSYFLTNQGRMIDDLEIRIFTVSGRLIRVIKNDRNTSVPGNDSRLVGYNELIWNGLDDYGNEVANGVYFALVRARFEEKEKQQILKVAKLRQ
ncbi:MAG: hypothetical protein EH225_12430, partial [Calditrichaeota bacterium]